jgi:hypothetical protein
LPSCAPSRRHASESAQPARRSLPTFVARRVLRDHSPQEHPYWPTEYIPAKREAAWAKFEPKFEADPELRASAEAYKKYFRNRR